MFSVGLFCILMLASGKRNSNNTVLGCLEIIPSIVLSYNISVCLQYNHVPCHQMFVCGYVSFMSENTLLGQQPHWGLLT